MQNFDEIKWDFQGFINHYKQSLFKDLIEEYRRQYKLFFYYWWQVEVALDMLLEYDATLKDGF